jgi:hypothetical protein
MLQAAIGKNQMACRNFLLVHQGKIEHSSKSIFNCDAVFGNQTLEDRENCVLIHDCLCTPLVCHQVAQELDSFSLNLFSFSFLRLAKVHN